MKQKILDRIAELEKKYDDYGYSGDESGQRVTGVAIDTLKWVLNLIDTP